MKTKAKQFLGFLVTKLLRCADEYEKYRILKHAKSCDPSLRIKMPVCVEGVENVHFGKNVTLNPFVHIFGHGGVRIGDRVMIGSHALISSLDHDVASPSMTTTILMREVIIENDVWIGTGAKIFPGVRLGKGCIVSAGSVVSRDVPPYAIVRGIPAKIAAQRPMESEVA